MTGTVRASTLAALPAQLANVAYVDSTTVGSLVAMLADRQTLIYRKLNVLYVSTDDGATSTSMHNFPAAENIDGVIELGNGELLVSTRVSGGAGTVYVSSGWVASHNGATWTKVLTCSGNDVYVRGFWGLSVAPAGSTHAGCIFLAEYGQRTDEAATPAQAAIRAYMSTDNGLTFTTIFDVTVQETDHGHNHLHGIAYDPWDDRVYITYGDGQASPLTYSAIVYSDNFTAATPTWTAVPLSRSATSTYQCTTIFPMESAILFLPDGAPGGIVRLPRRGFRSLGTLTNAVRFGGGTSSGPYIGASAARAVGVPGAPVLLTSLTGLNAGYATIFATIDGVEFFELWREPALSTFDLTGFNVVVGPTITGKIVGTLGGDGRQSAASSFTADLILDGTAQRALSTPRPDVQIFTSAGTWTKPLGCQTVQVTCVAAGGGGGSGRVSASGTLASGGAGGAGGGFSQMTLPASVCGATEAVTVGAGGAGGAAQGTDSSNGNQGTAAVIASTFGTKVRATGGNQGGGGTSAGAATGNNGGGGTTSGGTGASSSATGAAGPAGGNAWVPGGGAGGGIATTPAAVVGGAGGGATASAATGGTAGTAPGGTGGNGSSTTANVPQGGSGGGGGGSSITAAGGAGGNGGIYGAGGGGGGAALNGNGGSGKGGDGANGIVIVVSW